MKISNFTHLLLCSMVITAGDIAHTNTCHLLFEGMGIQSSSKYELDALSRVSFPLGLGAPAAFTADGKYGVWGERVVRVSDGFSQYFSMTTGGRTVLGVKEV